jgi:hypothetical protein
MRLRRTRALGPRVRALFIGLVLGASACGRGAAPATPVEAPPPPVALAPSASPGVAVDVAHAVPGLALDPNHTVGAPRVVENLAVFPVYARTQEDIGDFMPLDQALAKGSAVVRELDAEPPPPSDLAARDAPVPEQAQMQQANAAPIQRVGHRGAGAQVNKLVIENKGELPILVLAGTVVKGGKQDRQIGQDFVVGARSTVPVDAFCVEHGRWTDRREGAATGGKFVTAPVLANDEVRAAGQYERNQSEVWAKVGKVNAATKKAAPSGTLMATLDDSEIKASRARLAGAARAGLDGAEQPGDVVGVAYAVDGDVRAVRFFLNAKMFRQYEDTLLQTAAVDAVTAQANAKGSGKPVADGAAKPEAVVDFVSKVATSDKHDERDTPAENVNEYRESEGGWSSKATMKPKGGKPAKAVTTDYLKKKK